MQTTTVAAEIVRAYVERTYPAYAATVRDAVRLASGPVAAAAGPAFGVLVGSFPWGTAAGKTIRFSGYIKTDAIDSGYAGLWWRADSRERPTIAFNNMQDVGPRGTTDWQRYEFELKIPAEVSNINFGALHPGYGTAWFSDLVVEIDGKKYEDPAFDFSLASSRPRGFGTNGAGYEIRLDSAVTHNGHATLRMSRSHPANAGPAAASATTVLAAWRAIYDKLRTSSDTSWSARWAVQNARIVMQAMEYADRNGIPRSEHGRKRQMDSRAEPQGEDLLWAHNGHVATTGAGGNARSMGAYLREHTALRWSCWGAFNRGRFRRLGWRTDEPRRCVSTRWVLPIPPALTERSPRRASGLCARSSNASPVPSRHGSMQRTVRDGSALFSTLTSRNFMASSCPAKSSTRCCSWRAPARTVAMR